MEVKRMDTEPDSQPMEADKPFVVLDEHKLHEIISNGALDFDEWTSLISEIEKIYSDDIEKLCLAYDSFLAQFPLCYGYWRKYAHHKMRSCTIDKVVEVFELAVKSATFSVDLWVDYCSFGSLVFEDPFDVRRLFRRALGFVGKDYLCHTLWDKYIEFEFSQQHWNFLAQIYIETLMFPTKKLHCYYDSFKKFVVIWEEAMESHSNSTKEVAQEPLLDSDVSACHKQDELSYIIKELLDPSIGLGRFKALQKYKSIGEKFYQEACQLYGKINCFETHIRRPYFHVKPLDISQLENWHHYLDFVELHQDFDWAVKLYERCLIPCANYPEFWMRYVEFMESKGGREIATFALDRATHIFLKRTSVINLFNARFREHIGDMANAHAAFLHTDTESDPEFVENVVMKANMERRSGNFLAASNMYKEALEIAAAKGKFDILPILYIHFSRLTYVTTDSEDAAKDILVDGIKRMPHCKLLVEELTKFAMTHGGSRYINLVDSVIANAIYRESGVSQDLNAKDAEHISRLYIEFVDLCGTVHDMRKAWNRHIRLFPHSVRSSSFGPAMSTKRWKISLGERQETPVTLPCHPSRDCSSECLTQPSSQDKKLTSLEDNDTEAGHPSTEQVLPQISQLLENHSILSDQDAVGVHQSGDSDSNVQETLHQVSSKVPELLEEDAPEPNSSLEPTVTNETEGAQASLELCKENDVHQDYDNEPEQDLKPLSLKRLSLDPQDSKSSDPVTPKSHDSEAPQEIISFLPTFHDCEAPQEMSSSRMLMSEGSISNQCMTERDQNANVCDFRSSPVSTQATVSAEINIGNSSPAISASNQNIMTEAQLRPQMPAYSGKSWHQKSNYDRNHRDSRFGFHGHSHKRLHQQWQASPRHYRQAEMGSQSPKSKGYPSQPLSSPDPHVQQGSQVQSQYPASTAIPSLTTPQACSVQGVQQQNPSHASHSQSPVEPAIYSQAQMSQYPMQSNQQHVNMQNNQAYNQMWQYYYYQQQQQLLWQQQQLQQQQQQQHPQQQQLLQQQYQQQLLQLQYLQQQQFPYRQQEQQQLQQQQLQQQNLLYLQQQQQLQLQNQHKQLQQLQQQQYEQKQGQSEQQVVTSQIQSEVILPHHTGASVSPASPAALSQE